MSETQPKDSSPVESDGETGTANEITKALEALQKQIERLAEQLPEKKTAEGPSEEGAPYLVTLVGYHALDRAARTVAATIAQEKQWCEGLKDATVMIVERSDLASWERSYQDVVDRLARIEARLKSAVPVPGRETKLGLAPAAVVTMTATAVESVTAIAVALGKCIAFFTPETTVRGVQIGLGTGELAAAVAGRLRTRTRSVRLLRHQAPPPESALRALFESVYRLSVQLGQSGSGGRETSPDTGEDTSESAEATRIKRLLAEVEAGLKGLEAGGPLLRDAFSWELLQALEADYTHLLCLEVVSSGGGVVTDKGPLGTRMEHLGGCTITYAVLARDRTVCLSDMIPALYSFKCNPSAPEAGSLSYVAMSEETPVNPSFMFLS